MMKTILLLLTATFSLLTATAQYTENFEGTENGLTGNCWTLINVHVTNVAGDVISGSGSMYTDPPTGPATKDFLTPALNVTSTSFNVSFKYKLTNTLNGFATRFIEVGLLDPAGNFTSLQTINLPNNTPTTVFNFNQTFTLGSTGWRKLVIKTGGAMGSGNARLVFDDLSTNASPLYGTGTCNSSPVAVNDVFIGTIGSPVSGTVMSNDTEPNGEAMTAAVAVTSPDGVVVMNQNGSFTFTPNSGFTGPVATFTYQLTDNGFAPVTSNIAVVTLNYGPPVLLPVKLVSFSATLNEDQADLKWTTSSEKNASHFSIEKSLDGQNFSQAGVVFANGNSSELVNYFFTDKDINTSRSGIIYYRLRSIDIDGTSELSAIRMITIGNQNRQAVAISTYPNPVGNELRITIPTNWQGKKVTYELLGNNGQAVKRNVVASANQTESINLTSLAPGFYIARVICSDESAQQKIIKR